MTVLADKSRNGLNRRSTLAAESQTYIESLELRRYLSVNTAPITFAPHVDFSAGASPVAMVSADFNGDGNADLAVADRGSDAVRIFIGSGTGTFSTGPVLQLNSPPIAVLTGDFNGDKVPDIAVLSSPTSATPTVTVTIFLNTGNDTFSAGLITTAVPTAPANDPVAFTAADFNGDKKLDLAVTDFENDTVSILRGDNSGRFSIPVVYTGNSGPSAIVAGLFTGGSLPDLAITTITRDPMTLIPTKSVSLLVNDSTGAFTPGANVALGSSDLTSALVTANVSGEGAPDLVVGNTDSTASVLLNTGGKFELSSAPPLPAGSSAIAVGDFNLDGVPDLVSANGGSSVTTSANSVSVIPGIGEGEYAASTTFATATQPAAVVVADFNNDGKPDIATANTAAGTVSILLNTTAIGLIATQTKLTTSAGSVPAGSPVTLTGTITPASESPLPGETDPTGTIDFYDGSTFLGAGTVDNATQQAVLTATSLAVGPHMLTAVYRGDMAFAISTSAAINETITPTATQGPDLVGTFVANSLPTVVVPGETGSLKLRVTNEGNAIAAGVITNGLYLSLDTALDSSDIPIALKGGLSKAAIRLNPNQSIVLTGTYTVPADIPVATYFPLIWLNQTGSLAESDATNNFATPSVGYAVLDAFGNVAGRSGIPLQLVDANGTTGNFRLNGPGTATVNRGDNGLDVQLNGTTARSILTITAKGGTGTLSVHSLTTDSPIGVIRATAVAITFSVSLPGGAAGVSFGSIGSGAQIVLGGGATASLSLGSVARASLTAASGIRSLVVAKWSNTPADSVSAPWIGSLICKGEFGASLSLSGAGAPGGVALQSAIINGSLGAAVWSITGSVNRLRAGSVPSGWSGSVSGIVRAFSDTSDFSGRFAAATFSSVLITGNVNNADILAGADFGPDGRLGGGDDTFTVGTIGSIRILGSLTGSVIAAGLLPGRSQLLGANATLANGGTIESVSVGGADPATRIVARMLPKKARIAGTATDPTSDPRFSLPG